MSIRTSLDLSSVRLLIADRQRSSIILFSAMVRGFGIRALHSTDDAETAYDQMVGGLVNCVLIDDELSGIDALTLTRLVRREVDPSDLSIVLLTAAGTRKRVNAARDEGIDLVLARPFSAFDLFVRIGVLVTVTQPALAPKPTNEPILIDRIGGPGVVKAEDAALIDV